VGDTVVEHNLGASQLVVGGVYLASKKLKKRKQLLTGSRSKINAALLPYSAQHSP